MQTSTQPATAATEREYRLQAAWSDKGAISFGDHALRITLTRTREGAYRATDDSGRAFVDHVRASGAIRRVALVWLNAFLAGEPWATRRVTKANVDAAMAPAIFYVGTYGEP